VEEKNNLILSNSQQRQRYLMNCGISYIETHGREFGPKLDNISLLKNMVGDDFLKKHFGKDYDDIIKQINKLLDYASTMTTYYSDINDKIIDSEDISSPRFLKYKEGVSYVVKHIFFIDKLWMLMVEQTDLKDKTVPANMWSALSNKYRQNISLELVKRGVPQSENETELSEDEL
jgi:hypothetical protein